MQGFWILDRSVILIENSCIALALFAQAVATSKSDGELVALFPTLPLPHSPTPLYLTIVSICGNRA